MLVWDGNSWGDEEKRPQRDGSGRMASAWFSTELRSSNLASSFSVVLVLFDVSVVLMILQKSLKSFRKRFSSTCQGMLLHLIPRSARARRPRGRIAAESSENPAGGLTTEDIVQRD